MRVPLASTLAVAHKYVASLQQFCMSLVSLGHSKICRGGTILPDGQLGLLRHLSLVQVELCCFLVCILRIWADLEVFAALIEQV